MFKQIIVGEQFQADELDQLHIKQRLNANINIYIEETAFLNELYRERKALVQKFTGKRRIPRDIANGDLTNQNISQIAKDIEEKKDDNDHNKNKNSNSSNTIDFDANSDDDDSEDFDMNEMSQDDDYMAKMLSTTSTAIHDNSMNIDDENEENTESFHESLMTLNILKDVASYHADNDQKIDVNNMHLGRDVNEIAKEAMSIYLNICEAITEQLMSRTQTEKQRQIAEKIYLEPTIVLFIVSFLPLLFYVTETAKKDLAGSNSNVPCERGFKYPKQTVATHSHRYNLSTVEQMQHINECQLNYCLNQEQVFDETPYYVLSIINLIKLRERFPETSELSELYELAQSKVDKLKSQDYFWRRKAGNHGMLHF